MTPVLLVPVLAAVAAGWLAWRHETRRFDERSLDEPRGWDVTEERFRRQVTELRKRRRVSTTLLGALAGYAVAGVLLLMTGLGPDGAL